MNATSLVSRSLCAGLLLELLSTVAHARPPQVPPRVGPYQLAAQPLGAGGVSTVYPAVDTRNGQQVAVKVTGFVEHARSEAEVLRRVGASPGQRALFPRYVDYLEEPGRAYVVMEALPGRSLHDAVRGPMPEDAVVPIVMHVLRALRTLHAHGFVHGDVKPANVMLDEALRPSSVRLIDFNTTRPVGWRGPEGPGYTRGYAAPEQFVWPRGIDPRTDLYLTGATAFALVTGEAPFETSVGARNVLPWARQRRGAPLRRSDHPLWTVIERAMEPDPARRYASAQEMLDALRPLAGLPPPRPTSLPK